MAFPILTRLVFALLNVAPLVFALPVVACAIMARASPKLKRVGGELELYLLEGLATSFRGLRRLVKA